jgi:hypothetical protein
VTQIRIQSRSLTAEPRAARLGICLCLMVSLIPLSLIPALTALGPIAIVIACHAYFSKRAPDVPRWFYPLIGVSLLGVVLAGVASGESAKTLAGALAPPVGVVALTLAFLFLARESHRALAVVIVGAVAAHACYYAIWPTEQSAIDAWKFALGMPTTVLVAAVSGLAWSRGNRAMACIAISSIGIVNIVLGFRSMAGICFVAALLLVMAARRPTKRQLSRTIVSVALIIGLTVLLIHFYGTLAQSGRLGTEQRAKYDYASSTQAGLLLASRPEFVVSTTVIASNPLRGYGSRARVPYTVEAEAISNASRLGLNINEGQQIRLFGNGVNSHSILLGSWVQEGLLGTAFWIGAIVCIGLGCLRITSHGEWWTPLVVLSSTVVTWDLMFSPWSPHYAVFLSAVLAFSVARRDSRVVKPSNA